MTNDEYGRLVEFIGRKFDEVDAHFTQVDARQLATANELREFREAVQTKLAEHDERFREVLGQIEHLYGRFDRLEQEYQAIVEAPAAPIGEATARRSGAEGRIQQ